MSSGTDESDLESNLSEFSVSHDESDSEEDEFTGTWSDNVELRPPFPFTVHPGIDETLDSELAAFRFFFKLAQVIDTYTIVRKSTKWYKKLYFMLLDFVIHNSFVVFSSDHNVSKKQFLLNLINQLTSMSSVRRRARSFIGDTPIRLQFKNANYPKLIPSQKENKSTFRRCAVCMYIEENPQRQKYCYANCSSIPLCIVPCFELYHTRLNYS